MARIAFANQRKRKMRAFQRWFMVVYEQNFAIRVKAYAIRVTWN
jgi:hypothetical protein